MNIEYIRNFVQLSGYKSFSGLAEDLSISQSTLSHRIAQLEKELGGIELIYRTTKKFKLTEQGELFLNYATQIIELFDEYQKRVKKLKGLIRERITITTSKLPGSHILPKYIASFKTNHPQVSFETIINNSLQSIKLLVDKRADFAGIGSFMNYKKDSFEFFKIGEDKMYFVCSPDHKLLREGNKTVSFKQVKQYPYISREVGSGTRNVLENQFPKYNELNLKLVINDNDSIISAISESNYIAILSEEIAKVAENAGLIKILKLKEYTSVAKRKLYFLRLKNNKLTDLKKEFWNYLSKTTQG
ncbi:MAG: LysR family transcriptional regulator [Promethearchaeota archaeon]|nr:MAG: LysR family transcriptional regulator [Candidatus Lokiarchaeota archaeon]